MIRYFFLALVLLLAYALALLVPMNSALTLVLIGCIVVLAAIVYFLYMRLREVVWWINGKPGGLPGQRSVGVHIWIQKAKFVPPGTSVAYTQGTDPDGTKPIDPPPQDI